MDQKFWPGSATSTATRSSYRRAALGPPETAASQEVRRLYRAMVETLQDAIKHRGSSLADEQYRRPLRRRRRVPEPAKVYDREGQACRRCRSTIVRVKANGRSTFLCHHARCDRLRKRSFLGELVVLRPAGGAGRTPPSFLAASLALGRICRQLSGPPAAALGAGDTPIRRRPGAGDTPSGSALRARFGITCSSSRSRSRASSRSPTRRRSSSSPGSPSWSGPTAAGKSNIVDAVAWVLGAQGPRSVRSTKMEDVIFAGTGRRSALGRAEVSLTIDNAAGLLPIDFSEVTITRTLFRTRARASTPSTAPPAACSTSRSCSPTPASAASST